MSETSKIFDVGQCVRFDLGGLIHVDKSDKVEAAGYVGSDMGKARALVPEFGLSFAGLLRFEGAAVRPLAN